MAVVTCPSVTSTGEDAKVLTGAETYGHTVHCLQPVLETGGEGRTQMLHHPGAAVQMVVASHQGAWGSARDTVDYILHLNGSFKREWLGFPWQQAGSITRRWLSFLPQPTSGSGICPLPSLPSGSREPSRCPGPDPSRQPCGWSVFTPLGTLRAPSLRPSPSPVREGGTDGNSTHQAHVQSKVEGTGHGEEVVPGASTSPQVSQTCI